MLKVINNSLFLLQNNEINDIDFLGNYYSKETCFKIEAWMNNNGLNAILSDEDKMAFIVTFPESDEKDLRIIMPIIRRVMPNIIANDIIGVQPMSGPIGQIHKLRIRYSK